MTYRLPDALTGDDDARALGYLRRYFGGDGGQRYTGSYFDGWNGGQEPYRFTADDLVAVSFLSVFVPPLAARRLLQTESDRYTELLEQIGPDRDLVEESSAIDKTWPARCLYDALDSLPGVGPTIASKLCARKRPRLVPIYDSVVAAVTNAFDYQWEPLRLQLRKDSHRLHERLRRLGHEADLADDVTILRVYDVIGWMEGKDKDFRPTAREELLGEEIASAG